MLNGHQPTIVGALSMIVKLQSSQRFVSSSSVRSFQANDNRQHMQASLLFYCDSQCPASECYHMCPVILGVDTSSGRVPRRSDRCGDTCVLCGPGDSTLSHSLYTVTIVTRLKNLKCEMNEAGPGWWCDSVSVLITNQFWLSAGTSLSAAAGQIDR